MRGKHKSTPIEEIIIEAIKQNRESYDFVDNSMKLDKDVSAAFMQYSMI